MPSSHGRQKHLEKQKKKRKLNRQRVKVLAAEHASIDAFIRWAKGLPFGPVLISEGWDEIPEGPPPVMAVIVTRIAPSGDYLVAAALIDPTCLGIKDAFVGPPLTEDELEAWLEQFLGEGRGLCECSLLAAQSVVYHALDYARSLGFEPHPGFVEPLFGPRPAELLETPYAHPPRPVYVAGVDDDVDAVLDQLDRAVGEGNYDYLVPVIPASDLLVSGWE